MVPTCLFAEWPFETAVQFDNLPLLLQAIHNSMGNAEHNNIPFQFTGEYGCDSRDILDEKETAVNIAEQVWKTTGYHFTYVIHSNRSKY